MRTIASVFIGTVKTNVGQGMEKNSTFVWVISRTIGPLIGFFFKTPFYGAQTTLYCALEEGLEVESGHYYANCVKTKPNLAALDLEGQERLWRLSEAMVKLSVD